MIMIISYIKEKIAIQKLNEFLKENDFCVVTNYQNETLVKMSQESIKYIRCPKYKIKGENGFYGCDFFNHLLSSSEIDHDYVIYIDEDFFIYNYKPLFKLIKHFVKKDYDFSGVPDGGIIHIRQFNPLFINPFFSLFNLKKIRKFYNPHIATKYEVTNEDINLLKENYFDEIKDLIEKVKEPINFDLHSNKEPYYKIFNYLLKNNSKPLYLFAEQYSNLLFCTSPIYDNKALGVHTWYARDYEKDEFQTSRINEIYEKSKKRKILK